jgi:hypothetical protein
MNHQVAAIGDGQESLEGEQLVEVVGDFATALTNLVPWASLNA